jgi:putative protease
MEILAPAGGQEQLLAAVRTGADAVYLGTGSFNARRNAKNFGADELKQAVSYCHGRGVKVHVTVNTLVKDRELETLYNEIRLIGESGADAVIIQDMAVMAMFKKHLPDMPLHASTQLTVHNAEGALAARELGFSRVVLARELTLNEIRLIAEKAGIELEVLCSRRFMHERIGPVRIILHVWRKEREQGNVRTALQAGILGRKPFLCLIA